MVAASRLARAWHRVVVLEGRDELGGRTRSRPVDGDVLELGGQMIASRHRRMRKLVAENGLHLRREQSGLGIIRWRGPQHTRGQAIPPARPRDLAAAIRLLLALRRGPADDRLSAAEWLRSARLTPALEDMIFPALAGMFCVDLDEVSAVQVLEFVDGLGGGIPCLLGGLGNHYRIVEGMSALHDRLAATLPEPVRLGSTVTHVGQDRAGVTLGCADGRSVEVDYAILCVPATAAIAFDPPLPEQSAYDAVTFAPATKVAAVVPRKRAWQAPGFVGGSPVIAGWRTRHVLYGFALNGAAQRSDEELVTDLLAGFALSPAEAERTEVIRWAQDEFTHGTYVHYRPGEMHLRTRLARPQGRVFFASAERSASWPIHMEGAAESGAMAADEISALAAP